MPAVGRLWPSNYDDSDDYYSDDNYDGDNYYDDGDNHYSDDNHDDDDVKFVQLWPGWVLEVTKQIPRKERWCFE